MFPSGYRPHQPLASNPTYTSSTAASISLTHTRSHRDGASANSTSPQSAPPPPPPPPQAAPSPLGTVPVPVCASFPRFIPLQIISRGEIPLLPLFLRTPRAPSPIRSIKPKITRDIVGLTGFVRSWEWGYAIEAGRCRPGRWVGARVDVTSVPVPVRAGEI
ncbi:hypothetical protein EX30DRAFT_344810 [Ascodesmis nigricans]|uniref:Uncharacterized protein n=1 Tax=Ascodesmis nigricans TaxID=341454 RepID=A0A4S2MID0_9PEZI|nr:hypothetical protein EX30DRAFT_344810 [Ascodesmis nigricans]